MKHEIFRSTELGNERTKPVKVDKLPDLEQSFAIERAKLIQLIEMGEQAERELKQLIRNCKHHYFYDTAGFPYDTRTCAACGGHMGSL